MPGYIRYWDGTQWVAGTSKPMPEGDEALQVETAPPPPPRTMAQPVAEPAAEAARPAIAFPQMPVAVDGLGDGLGDALRGGQSDVLGGSGTGFPGTGSAPGFPAAGAGSPGPQPADQLPPPMAAAGFPGYDPAAKAPSAALPFMDSGSGYPAGSGFPGTEAPAPPFMDSGADYPAASDFPGAEQSAPPSFSPPMERPAAPAVPSFSPPVPLPAMGFTPPVPQPAAPQPGPAGSAAATSYRIRLRTPDGKPFDGPEITTGPAAAPWDEQGGAGSGLTEVPAPPSMSAPWGGDGKDARKPAPKVVVKSGPGAKLGHALAVLAVSALGIVPLAYLMLNAIHAHEDKIAETITVPTKVNVIDGTSGAYLGGMAVVLLVVALGYRSFLRKRRD